MPLNSAYVSAVMADSPWGFWQMQETSGTTLTDSAGGHNGTYDATVVPGAGPFSGWSAARFTGAGTAGIAGVYSAGSGVAFEFWCQVTGSISGTYVAFDYTNAANTQGVEYFALGVATCGRNGGMAVNAPSMGWACGTFHAFEGRWIYNVLQFEGDGHWRLKSIDTIDGILKTCDFGAHSMTAPSSPGIWIGKRPDGSLQMLGDYTAFAFYTTPLSDTRIQAHYSAAAGVPPPATCAYGTRKKATSPAEEILTEALIIGILTELGLTWWEVLLLVFAGRQVDINSLCASLPPQPPPPTPDALGYPPYKLLDYLYQNIWNHYCECIPGSPAAPPPPAGTATKPTGMPDPRVIVVNPTNPCLDITEVRRMLDTVIRQLNIDVQLDTLMQRYMLPFATVPGAAHSGLTGEGSFAISRLIGVQIVITARPPGRELEGAPAYVWDLGWASIMDGNGFIQERRITRDVEVWMPSHFQEAITFGYSLKSGVTARITELEAET